MENKTTGYLIVNFGGPRSLREVEPFLKALLTDREVVRTKMPSFFHNLLFRKIAKKRAAKIAQDYASIGGKSPIFEDTETIANTLRDKLDGPVRTFHRYLPSTHQSAFELIEKMECDEILVFPLFPQFTYATTGSIATFFSKHLSMSTLVKLRWIKSYPKHTAFIELTQKIIRSFLQEKGLKEEETVLLFTAHGLPRQFIETADLYEEEVTASFHKVMEAFPVSLGKLAFQSKLGPGEWLRPYTNELCSTLPSWSEGKKNIVFIPISFTSDHIETLFEIEQLYMPLVKEKGLSPHRLPAIGNHPGWVDAIIAIMRSATPLNNSMLVRCKCK